MNTREQKLEAFGRLLDIMDELRVKCPWDAKQTNESLRTNTIEETYELCEAIIKNDNQEIKKELGDVLWYLASVARYLGIDLESVALGNIEKLERRIQRGKISGSGDER